MNMWWLVSMEFDRIIDEALEFTCQLVWIGSDWAENRMRSLIHRLIRPVTAIAISANPSTIQGRMINSR
jgi:hypothetical protein